MAHPGVPVVAFDVDVMKIVLHDRDSTGAGERDAQAAAASEILSRAPQVLIVPTVRQELQERGELTQVVNADRRFTLVDHDDDYFQGCAKGRAERYIEMHPDPRECRAVAEAECGHAEIFLTLNDRVIRGLGGRTDGIAIEKPVEALGRLSAFPRSSADDEH
jgi:hypothetical protein